MPGSTEKVVAELKSTLGLTDSGLHRLVKRIQLDHKQARTSAAVGSLIRSNPYFLIDYGIPFPTVDRMAQQMWEVADTFLARHEAANRLIVKGDGALPMTTLAYKRQQMGLGQSNLLTAGLVEDGGLAWLPSECHAEQQIARFWHSLPAYSSVPLSQEEEDCLSQLQLNKEQRAATQMVFTEKASAVIGGAGVGKTYLIAALAAIARMRSLPARFLSFTGKSSEAVYQTLRKLGLLDQNTLPPQTIHRTLQFTDEHHFEVSRLEGKLVILEEAGTLTNLLLASVLSVLEPDATLVLIGDTEQLPPIGRGQPFESLLRAGLPRTELTYNFRQREHQGLIQLANAIRFRKPVTFNALTNVQAFFQSNSQRPLEDKREYIRSHLRVNTPGHRDWQCICDTNKLRTHLNNTFQELLNPTSDSYAGYEENGQAVEIRQWDKVIFIKTDYDLNVRNGQTGLVINKSGLNLEIAGEGLVKLPFAQVASHLRLGYAITTYKAQGMGWNTVIIATGGPVRHHAHRFYVTASTRAKMSEIWVTPLSEDQFWRNALTPNEQLSTTLLSRLDPSQRQTYEL